MVINVGRIEQSWIYWSHSKISLGLIMWLVRMQEECKAVDHST